MSTHYEIIVGTMLGASEYVADAIAEQLDAMGATHTIHLEPNIEAFTHNSAWIVCTSTHGAGELPDNIQHFAKQLNDTDITGTCAYIIGLGDTSYDTFCYGAKEIETLITAQGGTIMASPLHIDVLEHPIPEDAAVEWFSQTIKSV